MEDRRSAQGRLNERGGYESGVVLARLAEIVGARDEPVLADYLGSGRYQIDLAAERLDRTLRVTAPYDSHVKWKD